MKFTFYLLVFLGILLAKASNAQCDYTLFLGNDTSLCEGESLALNAFINDSLFYTWQNSSHNPLFTVHVAGTYYCEVTSYGPNLIENGDFEMGDTLFISDYVLGTGGPWGQLSAAGTYAVNTSPSNVHNNFAVCSDHGPGTGNMMICNGSTTSNAVVWSQTIDVEANTTYSFSTWITSVVSDNPAQLKFKINGVNIGNTFSPNGITCNWQLFDEVWNSGANTSAVISIVNQNVAEGGNDFALDDIYFSEFCALSDTIIVSYTPAPDIELGPDTLICGEGAFTLDVTLPDASYLWQNGSNLPTFLVDQSGFFWAEVTVNQCASSDSILVSYIALPDIDLGPDTAICENEVLSLDAELTSATYLWQDGSTSSNYIVEQEGLYWSEVTVGTCHNSDSIFVSFTPLPEVYLGNDTSICTNDALTLNVGLPNGTYLWQDGTSTSVYEALQAGLYWAEVTVDQCSDRDSLFLSLLPLPVVNLGPDTTVCENEEVILNASTPGGSYSWQDGSTSSFYTVEDAGMYWAEVTVGLCSNSDEIMVYYTPLPSVYLGVDTVICMDDVLDLDASVNGGSYIWQDGSTDANFTVDQPGLYSVEVWADECMNSDNIYIETIDCTITLIIPNVFSPNHDGYNEYFTPVYSAGIASMSTAIYNRWGKIVYESNNPSILWNGDGLSEGTYYWIISYVGVNKQHYEKKGWVELLR